MNYSDEPSHPANMARVDAAMRELQRYREREPLVQALLHLIGSCVGRAMIIDAAKAVRDFKIGGE